MITRRWFGSGVYSLLGHVHLPERGAWQAGTGGAPELGVVIVPPFGWEDVCSYRPLRELAQLLAASGIPAIRFDLPATGDSTGGAEDEGLLDAWIEAVGGAADELRSVAGVLSVTVIGIRMGALLALAAAARGADIGDLILWGGAAQGRSLLRELTAFRNLEVPEFSAPASGPANDGSGLEAGGFYLSPATVSSLEALDVSGLAAMPGRRVLILSRDEFAADKKLLSALEQAGIRFDQLPGHGYAAMMSVPHEARLNGDTAHRIVAWVSRGGVVALRADTAAVSRPPVAREQTGEEVVELPQSGGLNFGIAASGSSPDGLWLLLLNPGAARHIGPNRLWVNLAREWSARGVPSLRLDLAGIGESDGEQNLDVEGLYDEALVAQVNEAMRYLERHKGARRFALIGLCSGAFWAFHCAAENPAVSRAILINPRLFFWDPEVDRRREQHRNRDAVSNPEAWKRLVLGQVPTRRLHSAVREVFGRLAGGGAASEPAQIPADAFNQAVERITKHGAQMTLVFTEGEPLLAELTHEGYLEAEPRFPVLTVSGAGHTFRPLWAQAKLREIIEVELATLVSAPPSRKTIA